MTLKLCLAGLFAAAIAFTAIADSTANAATSQKKRAVAAKRTATHRPVPMTMAAPRARVTVQRRTYLDPGTEVLPGSQREFTDYAFPPGYSPTSSIEGRSNLHRSPLPGPFDLPGRDNPYPWNWCSNC